MTASVTEITTRTTRPRGRKARPKAASTEPLPDLAEGLEEWAIALQAERKSPKTIRAYRAGVEGFLAWHGPGEPALDKPTVSKYLNSLEAAGQSAGTRRLRYAALRLFSRYLASELEIADGLAKMNAPKKDRPVVPCLTDQEYAALLRACRGAEFTDRRDELLCRLMGESALRAGECIGLGLDDVNLPLRSVAVLGKGRKGRVVPVNAETALAATRYLRLRKRHRLAAVVPALFLGAQGRPFGYQGLLRATKLRAEAAGIADFHPHRLRHTGASGMLDDGMSEGSVMAVCGWSSRDMIAIYTGDTAARRAAAEFHNRDRRV